MANKHQRHGHIVPVLRSINSLYTVTQALEFGCGLFSTSTLLDKKYFPELQSLYSYETKQVWMDRLTDLVDTKRWNPIKISKADSDIMLVKYPCVDLIVVDGEDSHRNIVVKNLGDHANLFIIHDIDQPRLRKIVKKCFKYVYFYWTPTRAASAAIASNTIQVEKMDWNIQWSTDYYKWELRKKG